MKSKKLTKQAISWALYPNILKEISSKENSSVSVSHSTRETTFNVFVFVDSLTTLTRNPSNSGTLQVSSPPQLFSSQPSTVSQPVDRQPTKINMSVPQDQDISNNTEPMLESSAIPYNDNQLADPELWNSLFFPILLLRIEKFLNNDAQNITCVLLQIKMFIK